MKKINIFLFVLLLLIISGFFYIGRVKLNTVIRPKPLSQKTNAVICYQEINKGGRKAVEMVEGATALDLLKKTAIIKTQDEGVNAYVTQINGRKAEAGKREFWAFYVNGKMAQLGVGSYQLKGGDVIEWKIERY